MLLDAAVPRIMERARPHRPRLLLLMGSAAVAEAGAVRLEDRILPLSDLDLGLFTEKAPGGAERRELSAWVERGLRETVQKLRLAHNPIDLGLFPLPFIRKMPITLELCDAARDPVVLAGDPQALGDLAGAEPRPFEALRLLFNRVVETLRPHGEAADGPLISAPPLWRENPSAEDWRRAHRWSKLVIDPGKALLAASGRLEPSMRKRLGLLERMPAEGPAAHEGYPPALRDWTGWRLAPVWPPPELPLRVLAHLAWQLTGAVARRLGMERFSPDERGAWQRLLSAEGGPLRERARRWRHMVRRRPQGLSARRALLMALRWGPRVWPASLASLAFTLVWMEAAGALPGAPELRWLIAHEIPACKSGEAPVGGAAAERRVAEMVRWVRMAGA